MKDFSLAVFNRNSQEYLSQAEHEVLRCQFAGLACSICADHLNQSRDDVQALRTQYANPGIGKKSMIEWLTMLALCIDPSDVDLGCVSQLTHSLQVADGLAQSGLGDDMVVVGLVHDLGKILLLQQEQPANVVGPNEPIGNFSDGVGLDNIVTHWNHDEFIFQRLHRYLTEDQAWLLRYHSLRYEKAARFMNQEDHYRCEKLLKPFRYHDLRSKSPYALPRPLEEYSKLLHRYFPEPVAL